jgi:hypothetical protein
MHGDIIRQPLKVVLLTAATNTEIVKSKMKEKEKGNQSPSLTPQPPTMPRLSLAATLLAPQGLIISIFPLGLNLPLATAFGSFFLPCPLLTKVLLPGMFPTFFHTPSKPKSYLHGLS